MSVSVRRWCAGIAVGGVLLVAAVVGVVQARQSTPPSLGGTIEVSGAPGTNGPGSSRSPGTDGAPGASPPAGRGGRAVSPPPVRPGDDDDDGAYGDDGDDG